MLLKVKGQLLEVEARSTGCGDCSYLSRVGLKRNPRCELFNCLLEQTKGVSRVGDCKDAERAAKR